MLSPVDPFGIVNHDLVDQRGDRIVLHIFHHFLKARSLKVRTGITVVHKEHGVFEAVIGSVAGEQIFLRFDLSRGVSA